MRLAAGLAALALLLLALAWPFITRLGIEVDEAMIGNGLYERASAWYSWDILGNEIPVMLLTYLGALKTWLYNPIFALASPSAISLRLPMMLVAAAAPALVFFLVDRTADRPAAWLAAAMLATDPSFVLCSSIDLGFITFQNTFKLAALLLLISFHRTGRPLQLAAACFLLGLAMWDKAVFSWVLAAFVIAGLAIFHREIRARTTPRNLIVAALGFISGALPLIVYNIARPLETFRSTAKFSLEGAVVKLYLLKRTLDGSALFGFLTAADIGPDPGAPRSLLQHFAFWISSILSSPTTTLTAAAFAIAVCAIPFLWRTPARRPVLFFLTVMFITWLQMFLTTGAGGAAHHVILLWPFHLIVIAIAASELIQRRAILVAAAVILCGSNLLVMNQYLVALIRNGGSVRWTDAFTPLARDLAQTKAGRIVTGDWGILETLNLMSEGALPVEDASVLLRPGNPFPNAAAMLRERFAAPRTVWVLHSDTREEWTGVNAALAQAAATAGYSKEVLQTVHDRNGRAIFDIVRFRR